ncbi:MAG: DUF4468 domain-containing protein [Prevotella sp.]
MKEVFFLVMLLMPVMGWAQSEWTRPLTAAERLEQAKKAEKEAKQALKEERKRQKEEAKEAKRNARQTQGVNVVEGSNGWSAPEKPVRVEEVKAESLRTEETGMSKREIRDAKYVKPGIVPVVDGKVVFTLDVEAPGKNAVQIYDIMYAFLEKMAVGENQIESGIVLVNKNEHIIAAKFSEWLAFHENFISLDRTEFDYTILATCTDGQLHLTMERISYNYEEGRNSGFRETAEKVITDQYAVNKKGTKLLATVGKFRRCTIDRKDEIFDAIRQALK